MAKSSIIILIALAAISLSSACDVSCKNFINDITCHLLGCKGPAMFLCRKSCTACTPCPEVLAQTCHTCKDMYPGCLNLDETSCNRQTRIGPLKNFCRASCGVCTPCDDIVTEEEEETMTTVAPTETPCQSAEECFDYNGAEICEENKGLCNLPEYQLFTGRCRKSCEICSVCELPPSSDQATFQCADCQDLRNECHKWSKQGHCEENSPYQKVRELCPKSCGLCEPAECNEPK